MIPILYPATETSFTSNGIGRLSETISCSVDEERNGPYELVLQYPASGKHFGDLAIGMIIGAIHDDKHDIQPFDIYRITKPLDGIVTVYARHISYRLSKYTIMPMSAASCAGAIAALGDHIVPDDCPFTFWTDKDVTANFSITQPQTVRSVLGGQQGSILDTYGKADYEWDKWTVKLHAHRGTRTGQMIRYGKNLVDISHEVDSANVYNAVVPFWQNEESGTLVTLTEVYITAESYQEGDPLLIVPMDLSDQFEEAPTKEQLRTRAQSRLAQSYGWEQSENVKIDFVQLWQTEEYKDVAILQRLSLCDEVDVYHKGIGVLSRNIQIIKVTYDVLLERYSKMELGEPKVNLGDAIKSATVSEVLKTVPTKSMLRQTIENATELITGGLGGYVVIGRNANGQPNEILIMDTADKATAVNVIRINNNGIGFSTTGYNGPFTNAWTIDGHLIADFIDTGTLDANIVKAGIISDRQSNNYWNLDTGELRLGSETIVDDPTTPDGTTTLGTYQQTTETRLAQTSSGLELNFTRAMQRISDVDEAQVQEFAKWNSYIRFVDGSIVLGKEENPITLTLENDRISFKSSGTEVAYISDNIMYISNIQVTDSAIINGLSITEVSDGYLIDIEAR